MEKCFIIQPFDKGNFDKRYKETFKPAIEKAGLHPYRVDEDPAVKIPINEIERQIKESVICFAEITKDNPNVWYELGYAFACGKDVIMVCSDEREGNFPFDISHRNILNYTTKTKGGYEELEDRVTQTITARLQTNEKIDDIKRAPIVPTEGLDGHEIACLLLVMADQPSPESSSSVYDLKRQMEKAGYTGTAASLAIRTLTMKKYLETSWVQEENNYNNEVISYPACKITDTGVEWVMTNKEHVQMRETSKPTRLVDNSTDDLPF